MPGTRSIPGDGRRSEVAARTPGHDRSAHAAPMPFVGRSGWHRTRPTGRTATVGITGPGTHAAGYCPRPAGRRRRASRSCEPRTDCHRPGGAGQSRRATVRPCPMRPGRSNRVDETREPVGRRIGPHHPKSDRRTPLLERGEWPLFEPPTGAGRGRADLIGPGGTRTRWCPPSGARIGRTIHRARPANAPVTTPNPGTRCVHGRHRPGHAAHRNRRHHRIGGDRSARGPADPTGRAIGPVHPGPGQCRPIPPGPARIDAALSTMWPITGPTPPGPNHPPMGTTPPPVPERSRRPTPDPSGGE